MKITQQQENLILLEGLVTLRFIGSISQAYWTNQAPAPQAFMELICCRCKGSCQTRRCSCVSNGLPCTEACTCQDNCLNCISKDDSEDDDSDDDTDGDEYES